MIVLHIGLPKTATTFLQHRILARGEGFAYVHRTCGAVEADLCRQLRFFAKANALRAAWRRPGLVGRVHALVASWPDRAAARRLVVSDENIAILSGGFWTGEGASPERLARRLAALGRSLGPTLAPLRVVIGIRRQDQWLASRYAESSKLFPGFGQADFDRRLGLIAGRIGLDGPLGWLDYFAVRRTFVEALGAQNVLIVPMERLAAD